MPLIVHSARRVDQLDASGPAADWVAVHDGVVIGEGRGRTWEGLAAARTAELVDADGSLLTAGWVDQHCHGGAGVSFDEDRHLGPALQEHLDHGTRTLVASLVTNPLDVEGAAAARLATVAERVPQLAGIHLEGPFLDPDHKGAHAEQYLRAPRLADVQALHEACGGQLRQVTLAPEHDDDLAATRWLVDQGVTVAVGHTSCDRDTAMAAFDAGASVLTHAFNAMPGLHHRSPGPVGAALDASHVTLEVIADQVHVHPSVIRMLFSAAPDRIALITDAMSATGCADGEYTLGSLPVTVTDGVARLATGPGEGSGAIAGSTLTMDRAVRNTVACGVPLRQAVAAATTTPAAAMHLPAFPGVGQQADLFLVTGDGATLPVG